MRRAFTLIELLVVVTILPFIMVAVSGVYATFIRDIPQITRVLQENTTVLDVLGQIRRDVDGAIGLPPQFEGQRADARTLLIAQPGRVIRYRLEEGRIVRTVRAGGIAKTGGLDDGPASVPAAIAQGRALDDATPGDSTIPASLEESLPQERLWRIRDAVITWRLWVDGDRAYAVEVHSHVKQRVAGRVREKLANSQVFFLQGSGSPPVAQPPWRGRPALASRGHPGLAFRDEGVGLPNAEFRVGDPVPPSNRGHDARDTQGQDALATAGVLHELGTLAQEGPVR